MKLSYTVQELAKATGIGKSTIWEALRKGHLTARRNGTRPIILAADAEAWLTALPERSPQQNAA